MLDTIIKWLPQYVPGEYLEIKTPEVEYLKKSIGIKVKSSDHLLLVLQSIIDILDDFAITTDINISTDRNNCLIFIREIG